MKKLFVFISLIILITGCNSNTVEEFDINTDFDEMITRAENTRVTFYGWGGDEERNSWIDNSLGRVLKDKYNITLERVPMDIDQILGKLSSEKQAGIKDGKIDMIWINGENFYTAKEHGFLYGPFTDKLPNYNTYIDSSNVENTYDFGYPIENYEAPYGKAQLVLINDSAITPETPKNTEELLEFVKKYPGQIIYPALPDFTGSAFVRTIIYDIVGSEQFQNMEADKEVVKAAILPAIKYLKSLNPYLWNEGKSFPSSLPEVNNMFADGELFMTLSYNPYSVALDIENGTFTETTRSFIFDNGTVGNTNYIAISYNSKNKYGAMVAINEVLSSEIQASQFSQLKTLPVLDYNRLSEDEKTVFDNIEIGTGTIVQDELLSKRIPEMPAKLVPIIEEIWLEEVVGQ